MRIPGAVAYRLALVQLLGAKCQKCGGRKALEIHHVNGDPNDNRPCNLSLLCHKHHKHRRRGHVKPTQAVANGYGALVKQADRMIALYCHEKP